MKALIGFFVHRPLLVNLLLAFIVLLGIQVIRTATYSSYPDMDLGHFIINTSFPGASPEDVELAVTVPLEEEILKVHGIDKFLSSSMENLSSIDIYSNTNFSKQQNREFALDLQKAIDRAVGRLPKSLPSRPEIFDVDPNKMPIIEVIVSGSVSEQALRVEARKLQNSLREISGISAVDKKGYRNREVHIQLNPLLLHQFSIRFDEIIAAINKRNIRDSGGSLESFLSEKDVVAIGQFHHPKEVEDVIVRAGGPGDFVRVRDIAQVVMGFEDWREQTTVNGEVGISLLPLKSPDANTLKVSQEIRKFLIEAERDLPPGIKITILNDRSRYIESMLGMLANNAVAGIFLVFITLMLFFPFRFTFWVVLGIPTAILLSFALMPLFGISINQISMAALILMLGMLVDDAVVTSESIFRQSEQGQSPKDSAINGTHAVAAPVVVGAATTLLAFAPAAFLGGNEGKFMWMLPVTAMLVLFASLLECKLMLPAHMNHALKHFKGEKLNRRWFTAIETQYGRAMQYLLQRRYLAMLFMTLLFVVIVTWSIGEVKLVLYPDVDIDAVNVKVELSTGTSLQSTQKKLQQLEALVREVVPESDLRGIKVTVGHHDVADGELTQGRQPSWSVMTIYLTPLGERSSVSSLELVAQLRTRIARLKGYQHITVEPERQTPPVGKAVEIDIIGNNDEAGKIADLLTAFLEQHPGVTQVWTSQHKGKDVIDLSLNYEAMSDYGLQVNDITQAVRIAFDGQIIDELQTVEDRVKYRLQFREPERGELSTLRSLSVINKRGKPVPLRAVVEFNSRSSVSGIKHHFGQRTITVFADIDRESSSVAIINDEIQQYIQSSGINNRLSDLRLSFGGEYRQQSQSVGNVGNALILSVAAIFFLLVLLFNSPTQPILAVAVIPLGSGGVLFTFALQGFDLSISAMVGIIGLSGVLVNDSLVMIDRLNASRIKAGILSASQIAQGATLRLRPIFITTITTVAGLFPAAYGLLGENPFLTPMIMVMLWGVLFGSLITLFYLPCLYAIEQDISKSAQRYLSRWRPV